MESYIYSLSAEEILNNCLITDNNENKVVVNLNDRFIYAKVVKSMESYPSCAFFFQLEKAIEKSIPGLPFENALVYFDFGNIFTPINERSKNAEERIKKQAEQQNIIKDMFFENNNKNELFIIFPGQIEPVNFIPFDKSNSMARNCQMSFLLSDLKEEMNNRLMLDMKIKSAALNKLYAYRGLYLTGGTRIEQKEGVFELNEETVIVIKDDVSDVRLPKKLKIFTANKIEEEVVYKKWETSEKVEEIIKDFNRFDGQGLIAPEYAMYINDILLNPKDDEGNKVSFCGLWERFYRLNHPEDNQNKNIIKNVIADKYKDKMVYSMQVRLPFDKGVLHTVDFHLLIKDILGPENFENIQITDAFGKPRYLSKAKIILTESMFKCKHWLKTFCTENGFEDPIAYYFSKFKEKNHALYIANVDTMLPQGKLTSLNYQFLNPMALNNDELKSLVGAHNEYVDKLEKNKLLQKHSLLDEQGSIDSEYSDETILSNNQESWADVLKNTTKAVYDKKVAGMLNGMRESRMCDILFGRFAVKGECRFLARDLMAMVAHLVEQFSNKLPKEKVEEFKKLALNNEAIYLPCSKLHLEEDAELVLLRNPHLSRNEEWICRYHSDPIRTKYLGHLKGVVEIGYNSLANSALGGADFDGDIVKIVADQNVVECVRRNCYDDELNRKLALIEIPSTGNPSPDSISDDYYVKYETIKNTFSSRVGVISNAAVRIGRWEYYDHFDKNSEPITIADIQNKCAEATILTGLEIDSCKNGEKPDIWPVISFGDKNKNDKENKTTPKEINDDGINYLKTKNTISKMVRYNKYGIKFGKYTEEVIENSKKAREYYTISNRVKSVKIPIQDENAPTLDKLPQLYVEKKLEDKKAKSGKTEVGEKKNQEIFSALKFTDYAPNDRVVACAESIIKAYNSILKLASSDYKIEENLKNANYAKHINTILSLQYDNLADKIADYFEIGNSEESILSVRNETYKQLKNFAEEIIKNNEKPEENEDILKEKLLMWIKDENWQYMDEEERKKALEEKLGITDSAVVTFLTNFSCGGYRLLYYYAKEIIGMFFTSLLESSDEDSNDTIYISNKSNDTEATSTADEENTEIVEDKNPEENAYIKKYREIYEKARAAKKAKRIWQMELSEAAIKDIESAILSTKDYADEGLTKRAMQYVHALRSKDPNGNLFWNAFSAKDILMYIEEKPPKEKNSIEDERGEKDA